MTSNTWNPATSREWVGDEAARTLEAKARADAGSYSPPPPEGSNYAAQATSDMRRVVYHGQYRKRLERNARRGTYSERGN